MVWLISLTVSTVCVVCLLHPACVMAAFQEQRCFIQWLDPPSNRRTIPGSWKWLTHRLLEGMAALLLKMSSLDLVTQWHLLLLWAHLGCEPCVNPGSEFGAAGKQKWKCKIWEDHSFCSCVIPGSQRRYETGLFLLAPGISDLVFWSQPGSDSDQSRWTPFGRDLL